MIADAPPDSRFQGHLPLQPKARASHRGIPYTRLIRDIIEREISRPER